MPRVVFGGHIGMDVDDYFGKVVYTGSHELSTVAVGKGKVDAAFVATHRFDNVVNKGEIELEDVNVLWQSDPIPQDPFVYRNDLCDELSREDRGDLPRTGGPARGEGVPGEREVEHLRADVAVGLRHHPHPQGGEGREEEVRLSR